MVKRRRKRLRSKSPVAGVLVARSAAVGRRVPVRSLTLLALPRGWITVDARPSRGRALCVV